jgi:RsiW-degrading membrane proteinase PrsW (M82 family)
MNLAFVIAVTLAIWAAINIMVDASWDTFQDNLTRARIKFGVSLVIFLTASILTYYMFT